MAAGDLPFPDHFSSVAASYARFRPDYPPALFAWVAGLPARRRRAWDCGTGNGQAAHGLAAWFREVVATDPSREQLARARPHPGVVFRPGRAEASGLPAASVDLVAAAQAAHWFDPAGFAAEVRRVLAPGGAVAVWVYERVRVDAAVDRVVDRYYHDVVGPFWPPQRRRVEAGYQDLPFPFREVPAPPFEIRVRWTFARFAGYLATWSAARRWSEAHGGDPVDAVRDELLAAWGGAERVRRASWRLRVRAGVPG